MRQLHQLSRLIDDMPIWAQIAIALFLTAYSVASIYARLNPSFGKSFFSKVPPEELRTNFGHIFQYTVVPCIVWIGFLLLLVDHHQLI
jgi:hypothetical protein